MTSVPEYMPGARVRAGINRHDGTVERARHDGGEWRYLVRLDYNGAAREYAARHLTLGTLPGHRVPGTPRVV